MKKKLFSILLVSILVMGLAGCGESKSNNGGDKKDSNSSNEIELYPVKVEEMEDYRGRYGYVDSKGNWVIEPQYISASGFDPETGLATVRLPKGDYSIGYINKKGEMVIEGCGSYGSHQFVNGYAVCDTNVRVDTYSTSKLIDKDGKTVIDAGKYEIMSDVSKDGILMVSEDTISTIKYIKLDGSVVLETKEKNFHNCSGLNDNGYGYCGDTMFNKDGEALNNDTYGKYHSLNNNNYGFFENSNYMNAIYTIKDGKIEFVTDFIYKNYYGFNDSNYAMVNEDYGKPFYLIDEKGNKVNDATYKSVNMLRDGKWVVTFDDGSHQVLNPDGSILVNTFTVK